MTSIHGAVPKSSQVAVKEAQFRGQEVAEDISAGQESETSERPAAPPRRRRNTARQRGTATSRRSDGSPTRGVTRRRAQPTDSNPFVVQSGNDDVFGMSRPARQEQNESSKEDDSSMMDEDQENDESRSPTKAPTPKAATPRRPLGAPVPLGELTLEDVPDDSDDEEDSEPEYPPSPRKSPSKSPMKCQQQPLTHGDRPESSRAAAQRAPNITPPNNATLKPLAENSPFVASTADATPSPRKYRTLLQKRTPGKAPLFPSLANPTSVFKAKSPSSSEKKKRRVELDAKLWELCGRDIGRWNRGEFDGEPFVKKARRW